MGGNFARVYVHCVWATWDRQPLLVPSVEGRVYGAICAKAQEMGCEVLAIGGDFDHVHVLIEIPPTISVSQFVQGVKGSSSHAMSHEIAPGREFRWQGSYGAFSVSRTGLEKVAQYIRDQKTHHAERRTFTDWEKCEDE